MIKIRHTKPYECNISSNKVEYSTAAGPYFMMRYVNVPFFMPDFYSSEIISHHFHIDNDKGKLGIGTDMILGR